MTRGVRDLRRVPRWDEEVDVVVVGLGAAGAAAALEATRSGAKTLVIERAGGGGGTSAMSGGVLYLGGGTSLQKACRRSKTDFTTTLHARNRLRQRISL